MSGMSRSIDGSNVTPAASADKSACDGKSAAEVTFPIDDKYSALVSSGTDSARAVRLVPGGRFGMDPATANKSGGTEEFTAPREPAIAARSASAGSGGSVRRRAACEVVVDSKRKDERRRPVQGIILLRRSDD